MSDSCVMSHIWTSHVTQIWMRHECLDVWQRSRVTHMNESCHTCEWVTSHMWMSHLTHMNASHIATSQVNVTHINESVTLINESSHTYQLVMSHIWMSHVTYLNESCHTNQWVMSHVSDFWIPWCLMIFIPEKKNKNSNVSSLLKSQIKNDYQANF